MKDKTDNLTHTRSLLTLFVTALVIMASAVPAGGLTRIRDIARPLGERTNKLWNWGLVMGLNGKGDGGDVLITARPLMTMLQKMGNPPLHLDELKNAKNVALVMVTAELPRNGVCSGDEIDIKISCMGRASNLDGGILVMTPLRSANHADDTIYAWAQGQVSIPNTDNPTSGIIKNGAVMEVDFLHSFVDQDANGRAYFDLIIDEDLSGWQTAYEIALRINDINAPTAFQADASLDIEAGTPPIAVAHDPRNIRIHIPDKRAGNPAGFISQVMRMVVDLPDPEATIVINERTGTIAITGNVEITPCSVTVTGLMIRIDPQIKPQQTQWSKFDTIKEGTAKLDDLITALDQLNVSVKQKIDAIYALKDAGSLRARIKVK